MARAEVEDLAAEAAPGLVITVKVTPAARRNRLWRSEGMVRIEVTEAPEKGRATEAAQRLLAQALRVAPSRLTLLRGASSREKVFQLQ